MRDRLVELWRNWHGLLLSRPMRDRLMRFWRNWRGLLLFVAIMLVFRSAVADWNQVPSGSMKPGILAGDRIIVDKLAWDLRVPFTDLRIARWANPERGDVVTFDNPKDGRLFIKRVVAVPGDKVELRRNQLLVNGERASYTPLEQREIRDLPIDDASRYRFFREELLGASRVVMLQGEPGQRDLRGETLARLAGRTTHCTNDEIAAAAGPALAAAMCRCKDFGACSTFPPFTVPDGKYWMMGDNRDNSSDSRFIGFVDRKLIYGRAHAVAFSVKDNVYYRPRFDRFFVDLT